MVKYSTISNDWGFRGETIMSIEERVTEIERQVQVIRLALEVLKQWLEFSNETYKIDQNLFESINKRLTDLETK